MNIEGWDKYDWDGIALLLDVVEKSAGHPKLKNITAAALQALDEIANPPAPAPVEEEPKQVAEQSHANNRRV